MTRSKSPSAFVITYLASMLAILGLWHDAARAETIIITGRVVGVHDGDSITVIAPGNKQIKVRLEGIDAPELKQPFNHPFIESWSVTNQESGESAEHMFT